MQEQEIIEREERLLEAMKQCDVQTLNLLLHNNLLFHIPTGEVITKAQDIDNYRSGRMKVNNVSVIERAVSMVDDLSIVSVTIHLQAKYIDQVIDGAFKYLRVWKINEGTWQVIAGSAIQIK